MYYNTTDTPRVYAYADGKDAVGPMYPKSNSRILRQLYFVGIHIITAAPLQQQGH